MRDEGEEEYKNAPKSGFFQTDHDRRDYIKEAIEKQWTMAYIDFDEIDDIQRDDAQSEINKNIEKDNKLDDLL